MNIILRTKDCMLVEAESSGRTLSDFIASLDFINKFIAYHCTCKFYK